MRYVHPGGGARARIMVEYIGMINGILLLRQRMLLKFSSWSHAARQGCWPARAAAVPVPKFSTSYYMF
eukprot:SAG31_NODE_697_length_12745_cov_67.888502_5_plen_68_part_00